MTPMKFLIILADEDKEEKLGIKEVSFADGEDAGKVEKEVLKAVMSLVEIEGAGFSRSKPAKSPSVKALQEQLKNHELVLQAVLRTLRAKGLMSEPAMTYLKNYLGEE